MKGVITSTKFLLPMLAVVLIMAFRKSENLTTTTTTPTVNQATALKPLPPLDCATPTNNAEKVVCLANAFKATLSSSQIATLEIAFTTTSQVRWSNLPCGVGCRNGLQYSTLSATQLAAAKAVVEAASGTTANEGYAEFSQITSADTYLGLKQSGYSEGMYIIAFLGTPSTTGKWMLQFGGHHYAQNISFNNGKVIGVTPSHQGVEPLTFTNTSGTYEPLKSEQAGMMAMLGSFTTTQLASAKLATSFNDVVLGPGKDGQFPATKLGLACSTLTAAQKALVIAAMKPWTQDPDDASGNATLALYEKELDATYIAYAGNATLSNNADYVRIDGPSVWIEFVCQNGVVYSGIHYHAVYRDHTRDYGASGSLTGLKEVVDAANNQLKMDRNFPNPFSTMTTIPFTLTNPSDVKVSIFDMMGREVSIIANENMGAGAQNIVLNRYANGKNLTAGTYICKIAVTNSTGKFSNSSLLVVQ
jgi:Protein of unknown function (DUF3500)/Secretion system C-terminal sorting domain